MHVRVSTISLILGLAAASAAAHHSQAQFNLDVAAIETIQGTVTEFDFRNPHVYLWLETVEADGSTALWELEATSTPNLIRRGWGRDTLAPGDRITVDIHPANEPGQHIARVGSIHFPDGRSLSATSGGPPAPANLRATSLAGRWWGQGSVRQMQMDRIAEPWPLTAKAQAALAAFDGSQNPQVDCIPMTAPTIMLYTNIFDVVITDERVTIDAEWLNAQRTIYTDRRDHPPATERFAQGYSVGYWAGSTLIVDTQNFADHGAGNSYEIPSGSQKRTIERLRVSSDGKRMDYEFILEDAEYMTSPITGSGHWAYRPDLDRQQLDCDPEVARRFMGSE